MNYDPFTAGNQNWGSKAFRQARWQAMMEQIRARFKGQPSSLLCYWELQDLLRPEVGRKIGLREVRLASIVGSVERCAEYTRGFLPLNDSDQQRWMGIRAALAESRPLPPIRVLQVGEVYFVVDGNHRVSVARQVGLTHIQAHVVQIQTKVPLSSGDQFSDLLLKGECARFLERTRLDEIRPEADLRLTVPDRFQFFEAQIESHRAFLALDQRREVVLTEAVADWYDQVYLPAVNAIRDGDLLQGFPGWTEADLYVALCDHRTALQSVVGNLVEIELAAVDLARQLYPRKRVGFAQLSKAFSRALGRWIP